MQAFPSRSVLHPDFARQGVHNLVGHVNRLPYEFPRKKGRQNWLEKVRWSKAAKAWPCWQCSFTSTYFQLASLQGPKIPSLLKRSVYREINRQQVEAVTKPSRRGVGDFTRCHGYGRVVWFRQYGFHMEGPMARAPLDGLSILCSWCG